MVDLFKATILAVDDSGDIRLLLKRFLEPQGYRVLTAKDGGEAFNLFKSSEQPISMLLTDVDMPEMNGLELAERILQINKQLPILLISGQPDNLNRSFACLEKPFRLAELSDKVAAMLACHSSDAKGTS